MGISTIIGGFDECISTCSNIAMVVIGDKNKLNATKCGVARILCVRRRLWCVCLPGLDLQNVHDCGPAPMHKVFTLPTTTIFEYNIMVILNIYNPPRMVECTTMYGVYSYAQVNEIPAHQIVVDFWCGTNSKWTSFKVKFDCKLNNKMN